MPQAIVRNGVNATQDIFTWDPKAAADLLNIQLRWCPYEDPSECSLVCWTSSLLFALQYGLHRARQDNPDGYDPSKITLTENGLFELIPEFENQAAWNLWANRVVQLRAPFSGKTIGTNQSDHAKVRRAIVIAEICFPGRWALPVAVMLLALKPRMNKDRVILDAFAAMYSEEEVQRLSLRDINIDAKRLPEVKQFARLLNDIQVHIMGEDRNLLLDPFATLSLGN